jgi:hypothetical protein
VSGAPVKRPLGRASRVPCGVCGARTKCLGGSNAARVFRRCENGHVGAYGPRIRSWDGARVWDVFLRLRLPPSVRKWPDRGPLCGFPECPNKRGRHGLGRNSRPRLNVLCYAHEKQKQRGQELRPIVPRTWHGGPRRPTYAFE